MGWLKGAIFVRAVWICEPDLKPEGLVLRLRFEESGEGSLGIAIEIKLLFKSRSMVVLAEKAGVIALLFEGVDNSGLPWRKWYMQPAGSGGVRCASCEYAGTVGTALWARDETLFKAHAFSCQTVQIWACDRFIAVAAKVSCRVVVGDQENEVDWLSACRLRQKA